MKKGSKGRSSCVSVRRRRKPSPKKTAIAQIKVVAPNVALNVLDRAIQMHGGAGVSDDYPLAHMYAMQRTLRLADGPDEVHRAAIGKHELGRYMPR